jgi:hypothetical protein
VLDAQPASYLLKRTPGWKEASREKSASGDYVLYARLPDNPATDLKTQ